MKILACLSSLAVAVAVSGAAAAQDSLPPLPALEDRMLIASRIYAAMRTDFAHRAGWPPAFDPDSAYRRFLGSAIEARDRRAFSMAAYEFIASLGNGHTSFRDVPLRLASGQRVGISTTLVEDRWVVRASRRPGVAPGDVLESIDGEPLERFFARNRRYLVASDERGARRGLFGEMDVLLFPMRFTLGLSGKPAVVIDRRDGVLLDSPAPRVETRALEDGRVLYLRIPSFSLPALEESALVAVRGAAGRPAVVIDVRGNSGGTTPLRLIRALMDRPWRWWLEETPMPSGVFRRADSRLRWDNPTAPPDSGAYRGKLAILIDGGCFSACEDFVVPFVDNGRARVIGERTAGSTGQPIFTDLGFGMGVQFGSKREFLPDGGAFEGVGLEPHVRVAPTLADARAQRDPVLEKALRELSR